MLYRPGTMASSNRLCAYAAALVLTGCVTSVNQMQTARTLAPKETRMELGASVPISTRYFAEIIDTIELAAERLRDAEELDRPVSEAEQRQAIEGAAALLLLQPALVPELSVRVGVVENVDVGLRWAGPGFRLDGKWRVAHEPGRWNAAVLAAYTHHTGVGASIATKAFALFDSLKLVSFSRRDIELAALASTDEEQRAVVTYGGLRYILSMPRIESELADGLEASSGRPLLDTAPNIHTVGATAGVRLGWRRVYVMAELTLMWMLFEPEILGEKRDLGGLLISPGVGLAAEI